LNPPAHPPHHSSHKTNNNRFDTMPPRPALSG
jgi:hypothetical protein